MTLLAADRGTSIAGHGWHLAAGVAFFVLTVGGIALAEAVTHRRARRRAPLAPDTAARTWPLVVMAVAGVGAAAVHAVVMPDHFKEAFLYGAFFLGAAVTQLAYSALLLWRPSRALVAVGVVGNAAVFALWLVTRLVEVPLGPGAGETEAFGGLDLLASGCEIAVVVAGLAVLVRRLRLVPRVRVGVLRTPAVVGFAAIVAAAVSVTAVVAPPA